MAIKIEMLRYFAAVAECGNLVDASKRLNRSASAVSMMLKQLEDHLGKPLFETDRKSKLSPVGTFVLELAQRELRQFDRTVQSIESYAKAAVGMVRIASVPSVAGTILPVALEHFIDEHPNVQIDLRDMDSSSVLSALAQERVDIGIATALESVQESRRTPLFSDAFGLVCAPDHPLTKSESPLNWEELRGETFIANELCGTIQSPVFREIFQNANLYIHNTVSLLAMVKAGLGVTVLPRMVIQIYPGETIFRPVDDTSAIRRIDLIFRTGNTLSPVAEMLGQYIISATRETLLNTEHMQHEHGPDEPTVYAGKTTT